MGVVLETTSKFFPGSLTTAMTQPFSVAQAELTPVNLRKLRVKDLLALYEKYGIRIHKRANKTAQINGLLEFIRKGGNAEGVPNISEPPTTPHRPHKGRRNPNAPPTARTPLSQRRVANMRSELSHDRGDSQEALISTQTNLYYWACRFMKEVDTKLAGQQVTGSGFPTMNFSFHSTPSGSAMATISQTSSTRPKNGVSIEDSGMLGPTFVDNDTSRDLDTARNTTQTGPKEKIRSSSSSGPKKYYVIDFESGERLEYGESDNCPPPSLNGLVSSPARLLEVWDDKFSTGRCKSPLVIRGVPVPVKYWRAYYENFKQKRWKVMKQTWLSYQLLMIEYCSMTKTEFNLKWSQQDKKTGKVSQMPSGKIIKSLRKLQRNHDSAIVSKARITYPGDLFVKSFSYLGKGRRLRVMTSEKAIAKRYLELTANLN